MLDAVLARMAESGKSQETVGRVCLVGRLAEGSGAVAFKEWTAAAVNEAQRAGELTGLLMILPAAWILTVEGPLPAITALLRAIAQGDAMFNAIKVIASTEDVSRRYFQAWGAKQLSVQRNNFAEVDASGLPALIADTSIGMLKLGPVVGRMGNSDLARLDNWSDHSAESMPSNERVAQLVDLDEVSTGTRRAASFPAPSPTPRNPNVRARRTGSRPPRHPMRRALPAPTAGPRPKRIPQHL